MSAQENSVKKVVYRIEPKQKAGVLANTSDPSEQGGLSNMPKTVNAQFFQKQVADEDHVESAWGKELPEVQSEQRKLLAGVLVLAAFFLGCAVWALTLINSGGNVNQAIEASPNGALSFDEKLEIRNSTIAAYLAATTIEEKAQFVRDPERVIPLMEQYYKKFPMEPEQIRSRFMESAVMEKGGVLWRVRARDKNTHGSLHLLVETRDDGVSLVDWETDVIYQPSDWSTFKSTKSIEPHVFRALVQIAQLDGFHGFEFAEYNKFRCFKVTLIGSDDYLWAYTEIGSPEDDKMVKLITSGGRRNINIKQPLPVMLELRYPLNGQSVRCVHLSKLIQAGWLH
ncbi:MAG: hypothetical protein ABGY95_08685 [Rubritalea sp.]|uniref:hypothetical protein n=1 Tax=Rubritalea sp. TaxID=2109375 RepID=UPI003242A612